MTIPIISIIGTGNIGTCIISGLIKDGYPSKNIWGANPNKEKLRYLEQTFHINTTTDNIEAAESANILIFAIKPQLFMDVAIKLRDVIQTHKPLTITVAAGIREKSIQHWLGGNIAIVRAMPNTPALIGCGATALFANNYVSEEQKSIAESILRTVGITVWLSNEHLMDAVTALSGSGPAYFFLIMEALQQTGKQLGIPIETARLLTLQTALGAARMAIESGLSFEELRQQVTSPGGTTEKAISVLEENNIRGLLDDALRAAKKRSEELAGLLGDKK